MIHKIVFYGFKRMPEEVHLPILPAYGKIKVKEILKFTYVK